MEEQPNVKVEWLSLADAVVGTKLIRYNPSGTAKIVRVVEASKRDLVLNDGNRITRQRPIRTYYCGPVYEQVTEEKLAAMRERAAKLVTSIRLHLQSLDKKIKHLHESGLRNLDEELQRVVSKFTNGK